MSLYNGTEFQHVKGSKGNALNFIWGYVKDKIIDLSPWVSEQIGLESTARINAINELNAKILSLKVITPWDPNNAFPTRKTGGASFEAGNYVQITATANGYKAGDMLIATADVAGDATIANFGDIESNVDIATSAAYGTVKLVADLAAYQGAGADSSVVTKSVLQAVLTGLSNQITTAFQNADTALQTTITTAYESAISTALADYYSKAQVDNLLLGKTSKADSASIVAGIKDLYASLAVLQSKIVIPTQGANVTDVVPALANAMQASVASANIIPVGFFTKEGVDLKGQRYLSEPVADWSGVVHARKSEMDFALLTSPTTFITQIVFNPEFLTQADVAALSYRFNMYGAVPTLEQQLAASTTNPLDRVKIGKADGTSSANLTALEAKFV